MKALGTLAFGALVILAANFASAAPAKADSFGIYVGNGGFGIQVNDYDRRYYRHHRRGCWDPYYGRYVPCRYYRGGYPGYYDGYYHGGPRWGHRGHRNHGWNSGWRGRNHGWNGGHRGRHDGWRDGRGGRHDGWRGGRHRGHDGDRGRRGHRGRH